MSRRLRLSLIAAATLLLVTPVAWYWLLYTSSGASFVWSFVERRLPGELSVASMHGNLSGGLQLRKIRFRNDRIQVTAGETSLAMNIDLIPLSVELTVLDVIAVDVRLQDDGDKDETDTIDIELIALSLP